MNSVKIKDISKFMNLLLAAECFDSLFISEGLVETFVSYKIDGYTNKAFFDSDEEVEAFARWGKLRPIVKEMIKGKKIPVSMRFTLFLSDAEVGKYLPGSSTEVRYLINVRFEAGTLHLISATSTNTFTLDKSFEKAWDNAFLKYIQDLNLEFEAEMN